MATEGFGPISPALQVALNAEYRSAARKCDMTVEDFKDYFHNAVLGTIISTNLNEGPPRDCARRLIQIAVKMWNELQTTGTVQGGYRPIGEPED
jgi:hypothetical protein